MSSILIVTICSDRKQPGGYVRCDPAPLLRTWTNDEERNLLTRRKKAWELLRTTPEIRDGRKIRDIPCNKALCDGGDFGGIADASYLPAIQRYNGRFYRALGTPDARLELVRKSPHHMLILSGLYGLVAPDESIQDYSCHVTDDGRITGVWAWDHGLTSLLLAYARRCGIKRIFDLTGDEDYRRLIRWKEVEQQFQVFHALSLRRFSEKTLPALGSLARQHLLLVTPQELMDLQEGQTFACEDDEILITEGDSLLIPDTDDGQGKGLARMVPAAPWQGASPDEITVFRALQKALDSSYTVYHHVTWQAPDHGWVRDGEADFVIAHERRGILVLEVKGGRVRCDSRAESPWTATDRYGNQNTIPDGPFDQATRSQKTLLDILKVLIPGASTLGAWIDIGHAIALPETERWERAPGLDKPQEIILFREDLAHIREWIEGVFDYYSRDRIPKRNKEAARQLEKLLITGLPRDKREFRAA